MPRKLTLPHRKVAPVPTFWLCIVQMIHTLMEGPCTIPDLMEATGVAESTLRTYIKGLRRTTPKLVVIDSYLIAANGQPSIRVYKWKPGGRDAPVPRKPAAENSRNYRKRKKQRETDAALRALGGAIIPHHEQPQAS